MRPDRKARELAESEKVEMRLYEVIYQVLDDVNNALLGMLKPEFEEVVTGDAEVREIFGVPRIGKIAGCYVRNGVITRGSKVRFLREGTIIWKGSIASLRRFKDDVREVGRASSAASGSRTTRTSSPATSSRPTTSRRSRGAEPLGDRIRRSVDGLSSADSFRPEALMQVALKAFAKQGVLAVGALALAVPIVQGVGSSAAQAADPVVVQYTEVGATSFTVPDDVRCVRYDLIGAAGGRGNGATPGSAGGSPARSRCCPARPSR